MLKIVQNIESPSYERVYQVNNDITLHFNGVIIVKPHSNDQGVKWGSTLYVCLSVFVCVNEFADMDRVKATRLCRPVCIRGLTGTITLPGMCPLENAP